jgi:hypothetical protein
MHAPQRFIRKVEPRFWLALALIAAIVAVFGPSGIDLSAAVPAWSTPEVVPLTSAGVAIAEARLTMNNGRAAAIWLENSTTIRAAFRPFGGPFGSGQTLDSAPSGARGLSIAIGNDFKAVAAWAATNAGPVRTVEVSDLAAGTSTFGPAAVIFTSTTNQDPDNTQTAIAADGSTLITFRGDGSSGYSHIWSAERVAAEAFSVASRTGNFEVGGLRMAAAANRAAFAYAWGVVAGANHMVIGPRRSAAGTWTSESFASPYCCGTLNVQGAQSLVVDSGANAYMTVSVSGNGGNPGPNFLRINSSGATTQGPENPDAASFSAPAPDSLPRAAVDPSGNVVMAWIRPDNSLYTSYRASGDSVAFSTPALVATGLPTATDRHAVAMDSLGNAVIVWKEACSAGVCTLKSKMRRRGAATTFGSELTISTNVRDDSPISLASDGSTAMGVLFRVATTHNLMASFITTSVPDHITITSSQASLGSGAARDIVAEIRDIDENVITGDSSTPVTFAQTSGAGSVTGAGDATAASGIATRSVTGNLAGSVTITASAADMTSGTTTFSVVAGTATTLAYTSATTDLAGGVNRVLTVQIRDANGNVITTDNSTVVTFAQTSGTGSVTGAGTATAASGVATRNVTGNVAGPVTITASASGFTSTTSSFAVVPGSPATLAYTSSTASLAAGSNRVLTAQIKDVAGNIVTGDNSTVVTFATTAGPGSVSGAGTAQAASGVASKTVTGAVAGSVTIAASASGLTDATTTFPVTFGTADRLVFTSSTADLTTSLPRTLTAEIRDAFSNVVTSDSSTVVTFGQTSGTGSVTGLGSATAASGIASRSVSGGTAGTVTLGASASGLTSGSTAFSIVTLPTFTDDPIAAGSTQIKAAHMTQLREAIASLRSRYGLSVITWTDPSLASVAMKAVHLTELRAALDEVYASAGRTPVTYTDTTISAGGTVIKAIHISELRSAVLGVW